IVIKTKKGSGISVKRNIIDYIFFLLGSALYAFGFDFFIEPNNISPGGLTGIAAIVNYLLLLPTGAVFFLLNIPVLLLGLKKLGKGVIIKTLFVITVTSVFIDAFNLFLPEFKGERLLAAIFGGALSGLGLSLVLLKGATTGGVDIIAVVLKQKYPYLKIGRLVLILDSIVIALAAICYREIESALFAAVAIFISGQIIDTMLYGSDKGRLIFIVTNKGAQVSSAIAQNVNRGVTVLESYGAFENKKSQTLMCALKVNEVDLAIKTVSQSDPGAFTVVTVTGGIFGRGFEKK
ncbi:MAG: YitT family protein, partial [Clostridia bacterium]|nr:YitT family protein [Clostridia bacterium]